MSLKRINAIMRARFREYYRDKASWAWNVLMPFMFILGLAFIFSGEAPDQFKVGVLHSAGDSASKPVFLTVKYINFVDVTDLQKGITQVQRHQTDMLLDLTGSEPRYWINEFSAKGYLAEKIFLQSMTDLQAKVHKQLVQGQGIRYVDWVIPGVLAMNLMFACLWGVGWVIVRYRKNGVLRRLQATPLTPMEFLTAQVVARLIIVTAVTALVFVCAKILLDFTMRGSWFALFLVFFAGAACLTSMGLLVATRLKTEEVADGLLNLMSWPMMLFSGIWFSMEGTHPVAQYFSSLLPLTHLVDAARMITIDGAGTPDILFQLGILSGLTVFFLFISARLFRWS